MKHSSFHDMVDNYTAKPQQKIMKICEPFFQTFGLNFFFHQSISQEGLYYGLCTHPDYLHYYFDQSFHEVNPFIMQSGQLSTGVYFYNSVRAEKMHSTFDLAKQKYKINHSLVIIENESGVCNQYGFGISPQGGGSESLFANELPLANQFIKYFNDEMASVLQSLKAHPVRRV